jgi:hypothetical protein
MAKRENKPKANKGKGAPKPSAEAAGNKRTEQGGTAKPRKTYTVEPSPGATPSKIAKLPATVQPKVLLLIDALRLRGPTNRIEWPHYGKLLGEKNKYHCHLDKSKKWVACWEWKRGSTTIRLTYVGSHGGAPY